MASLKRLCGGIAYNRNALRWDASCLSPDAKYPRMGRELPLSVLANAHAVCLDGPTPLSWQRTWALDRLLLYLFVLLAVHEPSSVDLRNVCGRNV